MRATEKRIANVFDGLSRTKVFNSEISQPVSSELAEALAMHSTQSFSSLAELLKPFSERNMPLLNIETLNQCGSRTSRNSNVTQHGDDVATAFSDGVPYTKNLILAEDSHPSQLIDATSSLETLSFVLSKAVSDSHEQLNHAQIQITKLHQTNRKLTSELNSKNQECERLTAQLCSVMQRLAEAESKTKNSDAHFHHRQKLQIEDAINAIKCKDSDDNKHKYQVSQVTVPQNIYGIFRSPHAAIAPPVQWYVPYYPAQVQVNPEFCALPGCRNLGPYTCAGCRKLSYCSVEHQR